MYQMEEALMRAMRVRIRTVLVVWVAVTFGSGLGEGTEEGSGDRFLVVYRWGYPFELWIVRLCMCECVCVEASR